MRLARFPRRRYTESPTPLEPLPRLSALLGGPEIWIKRDDLLGLSSGGNKTRKLEFLVADALAQGADTLITVGAVQSNHCRLTLSAAVREGLRCQLVLEERIPGSFDPEGTGNHFLFQLLGAERLIVVEAGRHLAELLGEVAEQLRSSGRRPYVIPGGGSNRLGALGYVACARELIAQAFAMGLSLDHVVCASGSGGTHAGLVAGLEGAGVRVTGVSVRAQQAEQEARLFALANEVAELSSGTANVPRESVRVIDDQVGGGYAVPTEAMVEAVRLFARHEGILLDPVYTGKAAAGLISMARSGRFTPGERVVFLHTGGSPALYAYRDTLVEASSAAIQLGWPA